MDIRQNLSDDPQRICIFSLRNIEKVVARCADYEFEDVICGIDNVEMAAPVFHPPPRIKQKIANRLVRHFSFTGFKPGLITSWLNRSYDLFVAICMFPTDLPSVDTLKNWKERCGTSVCWIAEIWAWEPDKLKAYLKIFSKFDYIVINCSASVQPLQEVLQRPCFYMPPGIDTLRFSPYPNPPPRNIDVYSLGRKAMKTHQALLNLSEQKGLFYIHDTIDSKMETLNHRQHRNLIANFAKRSRYFLANAAKMTEPSTIRGQTEIGYRFLEGAASGTVMIGDAPKNEEFKKHFDWPDAVIHLPFDTPDIAETLDELDSQPDRLEEIRKNNIIQSLLRHDYVYRWRAILDIVGLEPLPALVERENRLKELADMAKNSSGVRKQSESLFRKKSLQIGKRPITS